MGKQNEDMNSATTMDTEKLPYEGEANGNATTVKPKVDSEVVSKLIRDEIIKQCKNETLQNTNDHAEQHHSCRRPEIRDRKTTIKNEESAGANRRNKWNENLTR